MPHHHPAPVQLSAASHPYPTYQDLGPTHLPLAPLQPDALQQLPRRLAVRRQARGGPSRAGGVPGLLQRGELKPGTQPAPDKSFHWAGLGSAQAIPEWLGLTRICLCRFYMACPKGMKLRRESKWVGQKEALDGWLFQLWGCLCCARRPRDFPFSGPLWATCAGLAHASPIMQAQSTWPSDSLGRYLNIV